MDDPKNNYALIIGVEQYPCLDSNGGLDVAGARNDAKTLLRQCLSMGIAPERIWVLTSPPLCRTDLPELAELGYCLDALKLGAADKCTIEAGLKDFGKAFVAGGLASGLITFSGHGVEEYGLRLCPSDYKDTDAVCSSISVVEVLEHAGIDALHANNITVLLDCCDAGGVSLQASLLAALKSHYLMPSESRGSRRPLSELAEPLLAVPTAPKRVIASCRAGGTSVSSTFGGQRQGAFTWAITSVMGQWSTTSPLGVAQLTITYEELVSRTTKLLAALSFKQQTTLIGLAAVRRLPFLQPGLTEYTSKAPDADRPTRQVRPYVYLLRLGGSSGAVVAEAIATGATPPQGMLIGTQTPIDDTEYWFVNTLLVTATNLKGDLWVAPGQLQSRTYPDPPSGWTTTQSFNLAEDQAWIKNQIFLTNGTDETNYFWSGTASEGWPIGLQLRVKNNNTVTGIGWWQVLAKSDTPTLITPNGTLKVAAGPPQANPQTQLLWGVAQQDPPP